MKTINIKIKRLRSITYNSRLYYCILIFFFFLKKWDAYNITILLNYSKDNIELVCAESYKKRFYSVSAGLMVDYEEQVIIIVIKTNI